MKEMETEMHVGELKYKQIKGIAVQAKQERNFLREKKKKEAGEKWLIMTAEQRY